MVYKTHYAAQAGAVRLALFRAQRAAEAFRSRHIVVVAVVAVILEPPGVARDSDSCRYRLINLLVEHLPPVPALRCRAAGRYQRLERAQ